MSTLERIYIAVIVIFLLGTAVTITELVFYELSGWLIIAALIVLCVAVWAFNSGDVAHYFNETRP